MTQDRPTSVRSTGLVAEFDTAGVLGLADVHTAQQLSFLGRDDDERVALAIALAVRAVRAGSVCIDLATIHDAVFEADETEIDASALPWPETEGWLGAVADSPLVAHGPGAPAGRSLRLDGTLLYLDRYWRDEQLVRADIAMRRSTPMAGVDTTRLRDLLAQVFPRRVGPGGLAVDEPDAQLAAAATTAAARLCVLSGGPGTGKTSTIARILVVLATLDPDLHIGLAAPTGKAAARLTEAIHHALPTITGAAPQVVARLGRLQATTVHSLLGWAHSSIRFAHDRTRPLPYDVVVVDEMSMVSLSMMARLLEATRPDARLLLVGDPDQLASVEAGAVFADIGTMARRSDATGQDMAASGALLAELVPEVDRPAVQVPGVVDLTHTWRFGGMIAELAQAITAGDVEGLRRLLAALGPDANVSFTPTSGRPDDPGLAGLRRRVGDWGAAMRVPALAGDGPGALEALGRHRILCAHRRGPYGVAVWNAVARGWVDGATGMVASADGVGEPLMATRRDKPLQVFNGDVGVVVDHAGEERLALEDLSAIDVPARRVRLVAPQQLEGLVPVYASTIHKSQGSQFEEVSIILPEASSPLLTRELLYTAVTRASGHVHLYGTTQALERAVERRANRASGLV